MKRIDGWSVLENINSKYFEAAVEVCAPRKGCVTLWEVEDTNQYPFSSYEDKAINAINKHLRGFYKSGTMIELYWEHN